MVLSYSASLTCFPSIPNRNGSPLMSCNKVCTLSKISSPVVCEEFCCDSRAKDFRCDCVLERMSKMSPNCENKVRGFVEL